MSAEDHTGHQPPMDDTSTEGRTYHLDSRGEGANTVGGTRHNDTYHLATGGHPSDQIHVYAGRGDDVLHLDMRVDGSRHIQHGHHIRLGEGQDRVIFEHLDEMEGTVVGRFDDLNFADDQIWIGNQHLDLTNPGAIEGFDAKVVEYMGQQWLDISNDIGGRLFYALEGPRNIDGVEEPHFLRWDHQIPAVLEEVTYVDPLNEIPTGVVDRITIDNVIDNAGSEVIGTALNDQITLGRDDETAWGGAGDDVIYGDRGNDTIHGEDGNDILMGGRGNDLLLGGTGDDILAGGLDRDTIYGGEGDDILVGGSEDDYLDGGAGNDSLHGGSGNDYLNGGPGDDILMGGEGNETLMAHDGADTLVGGAGDDVLSIFSDNVMAAGEDGNDTFAIGGKNVIALGGEGNDIYDVRPGATVTIGDFDAANDKLDIALYFADRQALLDAAQQVDNPDDPEVKDLVIAIPNSGSILLPGQGSLAESADKMILGWDEDDGDLPDNPPVDDLPDDDEKDADRDDEDDDGGLGALIGALGAGVLAFLAFGGVLGA